MRKILILICIIFLITGCTNVKNLSYGDALNTIATTASKPNTTRTGYKYFLPKGMQVVDSTLYNEVIEDELNSYYLYVDVVSYYQKKEKRYSYNKTAIFSEEINYDGKYGYLEINLTKNDKYLVEIMYNYAKIEVIVDKSDVNRSLLSAINILKSIEYNDEIIANLLGEDILNYSEEEYDIFNTKGSDNNYITIDENYKSTEEEIPDTDLIN